MHLIEKHIVSRSHKDFKNIDNVCFLSKNLYNVALYTIKQEFLSTGKWLRYNQLDKLFKENNQPDYRAITNNSAQQILMVLDTNLKSYFQAIKAWKRDPKKFTGCPKFPRYKDKVKGRNIFIYTYVQVGFKNGFITFPKKEGLPPLKTCCKIREEIKQIRIIPHSSCYTIEVVYEQPEIIKECNQNFLAIDLGLNNLATCTTSTGEKPFIVNGRQLKSINQFYNKKRAEIQSQLEKNHKKKSSKRLDRLTLKRNNKIIDYVHKSSKHIIQYCIENNIDNIILGKNDGWKQEINIGKKNNQAFVSVPFDRFEQQLAYKSKLKGLTFQTVNEAYTSKCSALDQEPVKKQEVYLGKRIKRGLFRASNGRTINADVNGSFNILRKVVTEFEVSDRGLGYNPSKIDL